MGKLFHQPKLKSGLFYDDWQEGVDCFLHAHFLPVGEYFAKQPHDVFGELRPVRHGDVHELRRVSEVVAEVPGEEVWEAERMLLNDPAQHGDAFVNVDPELRFDVLVDLEHELLIEGRRRGKHLEVDVGHVADGSLLLLLGVFHWIGY